MFAEFYQELDSTTKGNYNTKKLDQRIIIEKKRSTKKSKKTYKESPIIEFDLRKIAI